MSTYIETEDIKDRVIARLGSTVIDPYIDDAENYFTTAVIFEEGLTNISQLTATTHEIVKNYLRAYTCMIICRDYMGDNMNERLEDVYREKYLVYKDDAKMWRDKINYAILTGTALDEQDFTSQITTIARK